MIEVGRGELDAEQFSVLTSEARARANAAAFGEAAAIYCGRRFRSGAGGRWPGSSSSRSDATSSSTSTSGGSTALMDRIDCELALGRHDDLLGELEVLARRASAARAAVRAADARAVPLRPAS